MLALGVDGCKVGWMVVAIESPDKFTIEIFSSIESIWQQYSKARIILVDIPIGLRDSGSIPRLCDSAAREILRPLRSSSIFPPPCRAVLAVNEYIQANQLNRERTGKGLSKQAWNITPKIKQMDSFLQSHPEAREIVLESHPEVVFWGLNKRQQLRFYKKDPAGAEERLNIIESFNKSLRFEINRGIQERDPKKCEKDDIIDAAGLAVAASLNPIRMKRLPAHPEIDATGLPMQIIYYD